MKRQFTTIYSVFLFMIGSFSISTSASIIQISLKPFPTFNEAKHIVISNVAPLINISSPISGIIASYAGYINSSDLNGFIIFPRLQDSPLLHIVVTSHVIPIIMFANTVHHMAFDSEVKSYMVSAEQKYDLETDLTYWEVKEQPLPANDIIPINSVIIIADPDEIFIPLGVTPTFDSHHLILPEIYVKPKINNIQHVLYMLNLNMFFGSLYQSNKYYLPQKVIESITHP